MLYDSFGIRCKGTKAKRMSPDDVLTNITKVNDFMKEDVQKVKERNNLTVESSTNGP